MMTMTEAGKTEAGRIRAAIAAIVAATGCDRRTVLRAVTEGADVIRTARTRELLRAPVEDARYALDLSDPADDEWIAAQARVDQADRCAVEARERGIPQQHRFGNGGRGHPLTKLREKLRKAISSGFLADGDDVLADVVHQVRSGLEADSSYGPPWYLTDRVAGRHAGVLQRLVVSPSRDLTSDGKAALRSAVVALYARLGELRAG